MCKGIIKLDFQVNITFEQKKFKILTAICLEIAVTVFGNFVVERQRFSGCSKLGVRRFQIFYWAIVFELLIELEEYGCLVVIVSSSILLDLGLKNSKLKWIWRRVVVVLIFLKLRSCG